MASILAIVSRDAWNVLVRQHGPIEPGRVVPLDRYLSRHKGLDGLGAGGALWLATVRPDPVRLWLVAVLRNPTGGDDGWYAEPNTHPVTDLTALAGELRFSSGKGLPADPSKLAMALQTPRALTDDDLVRLRAVAEPSPGSAYHAAVLATVEEGSGRKPRAKRASPVARAAKRTGGPRPWREALAAIEVWRTLSDAARSAVVAELCREISRPGRTFRPSSVRCGVDLLATVEHEQSGSELVVVPGGVFAKGFTADDFFALWRATGIAPELVGELHGRFADLRPRAVAVRPFLLGRQIVDAGSLCRAAGVADGRVAEALTALGWRLPTSAEWEWIAREGGAVRFVGVPRDKHPLRPTLVPPAEDENGWGFGGLLNEENRTQDGFARMGHTWWQWEAEAAGLHAANEYPGSGGRTRLAADLPDAPEPSTDGFDWAATCAETLEALLDRNAKDRQAAVLALWEMGAAPSHPASPPSGAAPDVHPAAEGAVRRLSDVDPELRPRLLVALGQLAAAGAVAEVASARDALVRDLADRDEAVRTAAWFAWAQISDGTDLEAVRPALAAEKKPTPLASALLGLAAVTGRAKGEVPELAAAGKHKHPLVRGAAAIARAELGAGIEGGLLDALSEAAALGRVAALPWYDGRIGARADDLVKRGGQAGLVKMALALAAGKPSGKSWKRALELLFGKIENNYDKPPLRDAAGLSAAQREALERMSRLEPAPDIFVGFRPRGLPEDLEDRRIWLGLQPPMTMEALTVGDRPFWRWADEGKGDAALAQRQEVLGRLLEGLSPFERLALALENGRYGIWFADEPGDRELSVGVLADLAGDAARLDRARARAVIRHRLDSVAGYPVTRKLLGIHQDAVEAWTATLEPGARLPDEIWRLIRATREYPTGVLEAAPAAELVAHLCQQLDEQIAEGLREDGWVTWAQPDLVVAKVAVLPAPELARRALALGMLRGGWADAEKALAELAEANAPLKPVLEAFRANRPSGGAKSAKQAVRHLMAE